ncbi:MAG: glycosyltransferase family 2 protein [Acidobacteriota bacterium]
MSQASDARRQPRLCAVIVHHRGLEMLDDCLRSLLRSEGVALDIVIVSNGCDEPLPAIVESEPRIHVARPPAAVGFSEANNLGAAWARENLPATDSLCFINNDTESRPDTLAVLEETMRREGAAIAGPLTLIHAAPDHINSVGIRVTEDAGAWDDGIGLSLERYGELPGVREVAAVTGSALLIDTSFFESIGGWNEVYEWYYEDIDLCLRAWKRGRRVVHVPDSVILHRISATMSEGSERKSFYFRRNRLLIGVLHWPLRPLGRLLRRALVDEILLSPRKHTVLHRRALGDLVRRLPRYLRMRRALRGDDSWARFLEPIGSVPPIELPRLTTAEAPSADEAGPKAAPALPAEDLWRDLEELAGAEESDGAADGRRILVLGWGPLPVEEAVMHFAPGGRTWQIASALAADGHRVGVLCARMPGAYGDSADSRKPSGPPRRIEGTAPNLFAYSLELERFEDDDVLRAALGALRPEAIVGAAPVPSLRASELAADEVPIWIDLFGDPLAEAQAKAMASGGGDTASAYLRLMNRVLGRGDVFSAVSERQKWAVVGQLGLAGRLGGATAGEPLVHVMPCAALELGQEPEDSAQAGSAKRGTGADGEASALGDLPDGAILALWSGSFNTWCDAPTLFEAVEQAMDARPQLIFAVTGGAVRGHDETTYETLLRLLETSRHPDRWRLLGQPAEAAVRRPQGPGGFRGGHREGDLRALPGLERAHSRLAHPRPTGDRHRAVGDRRGRRQSRAGTRLPGRRRGRSAPSDPRAGRPGPRGPGGDRREGARLRALGFLDRGHHRGAAPLGPRAEARRRRGGRAARLPRGRRPRGDGRP